MDDAWVEDVRREAGPCPACGAEAAMPVVYGMPISTDYERYQGRVAFAGCCLLEVLHLYSCGRCGHEWGERPVEPPDPSPGTFEGL